jgi:hypothetical protein
MSATNIIRRKLRVRELPPSWREDLLDDPEATVEVTIRTLSYEDRRSPKRFLGAGRGLFASSEEIDAHLRALRDEWES